MKSLRSQLMRRFVWSKVKEFWHEAFPPEKNVDDVFEERKKRVREEREQREKVFTEEELKAFEESIPEWKRGAVVHVGGVEEPAPRFQLRNRIRSFLRHRYKDNQDMMNLLNELDGVKDSVTIAKENIQQKLVYSDNVVVTAGAKAYEKIKDKISGDAMAEMKKRNPDFDPEFFEKEICFVFEKAYHEYLNHNVKYLEKICAGEALSHFRELIAVHKAKFGVPKYRYILNPSKPNLTTSFVLENKTPVFGFSINFQELYCLVDKDDPENIVDGDEKRMNGVEYDLFITPHPDPEIESIGHEWLILRLSQKHKVKQLL